VCLKYYEVTVAGKGRGYEEDRERTWLSPDPVPWYLPEAGAPSAWAMHTSASVGIPMAGTGRKAEAGADPGARGRRSEGGWRERRGDPGVRAGRPLLGPL